MSTQAVAPKTELAEPSKPYPSAAAGWFLVVMLTIAYIFSFVDRYILGLLVEPIKDEFSLSDIEIGWLLSAFTIIYGFVGIFMGWLIDRGRRMWIVSIGVALWSAATVATGMAKNFAQLFVARMSVGVGEATLSPATFSMIGDSFPPEKRGKPIAFYSSALPIGAGLASLLSAGIIAWAASGGSQSLPFFGELSPWRFTLIVVGVPGILLALIFLLMKEPARRPAPTSEDVISGSGFGDAVRYIFKNFALFAGVVLIVCCMTAIAYSQGLLPSTFERTWGWSPQKYALINGISLLIIGPINMLIFGSLSDKMTGKGIADAPLKILYLGFFIMVPTGVLPFFMPTPEIAFAVLCLNTIGIGIVSAIGVTALLAITPSQIRGQIIALYYLGISWFGSLGPIATGYLSNLVYGEENIRYAVATVPVLFAIIPLILMPMTRRLYREQLAKIGETKG
ncbi:MAG: MFS transporter [Erythrobacter sp.]